MYLILGKKGCAGCAGAKALVEAEGKAYNYVDVEEDDDALQMMVERGFRSLPQIFYNEKHIGGFSELQKYINDN